MGRITRTIENRSLATGMRQVVQLPDVPIGGVRVDAPAAWMHEFTDPFTGERRQEPRRNKPSDYELQPGDTVRPLVYADGVKEPHDR